MKSDCTYRFKIGSQVVLDSQKQLLQRQMWLLKSKQVEWGRNGQAILDFWNDIMLKAALRYVVVGYANEETLLVRQFTSRSSYEGILRFLVENLVVIRNALSPKYLREVLQWHESGCPIYYADHEIMQRPNAKGFPPLNSEQEEMLHTPDLGDLVRVEGTRGIYFVVGSTKNRTILARQVVKTDTLEGLLRFPEKEVKVVMKSVDADEYFDFATGQVGKAKFDKGCFSTFHSAKKTGSGESKVASKVTSLSRLLVH